MTQQMIATQVQLTEPQKNAWLSLAVAKNNLSTDLNARELQLQGLLLSVPDDAISARLAEYRKLHTDMIDARKKFTGIITDKLITPMMEWEKRCDPKVNPTYTALSSRELQLRKDATDKLLKDQAIATERGQFKAHFQNEYMRLTTEYRHALAGIAQQAYHDCLLAKTPADHLDTPLAVVRLAMADVKKGTPNKFTRVHLTPEDAAAMYKQLHTPDYGSVLTDALSDLNEKFSMYAHDLANAEDAAKQSQVEFEATIVEEVREIASEQAANVLMASAESFVLPDTAFKPVVAQQKIVIEDNSEGWVVKIITAFLANFNSAFPKTKNKKYSSLTVAQMCAALDSAGIVVKGVQYTTVEK